VERAARAARALDAASHIVFAGAFIPRLSFLSFVQFDLNMEYTSNKTRFSISTHRRSVAYQPQLDSNDSSSEENSAQPKRVTPSKLMEMLGVNVASISEKDNDLWVSIEAAAPKGIKVRYTDSGQPVLKFDANSQLPTWLMVALRTVGNPGAGCKLAGMIKPSARTSPLICLLQEINSSEGMLTPDDEALLRSALVGSCKYIIKTEAPLALLTLCPSHLKGPVVADLLALLPFGCGNSAKLLSKMTKDERSAAYAIAIKTARSQTNWEKQIDALRNLKTKLHSKFPHTDLADELARAIAPLPETTIAYATVESSAVDWNGTIARMHAIAAAATSDESLKELNECEHAIAAALKDGLTIGQLKQLAGAVNALSFTTDWPRMDLARRLGARLMEAVPYMDAPPKAEEFDSIVSIVIVPSALDDDLKTIIRGFCLRNTALNRFSCLEAAESRAREANFPLDFLSAIPKCLPQLGFEPAAQRLDAYSKALVSTRPKGNTLLRAAYAMGWPEASSFPTSVAKFDDLLHKEKYEKAEEVLKDVVDPMFVAAATMRLQELKAAKSRAMKLPWQ
jgi:hypothetical protein